MNDITKEIESLRDFIESAANYDRIWMQYMPDKYTPNQLSIRYIGDTSIEETGYHVLYNREYQFVYFGNSELNCIQNISALQNRIKQAKKIEIKDSDSYLTIGDFSFSQPFKTESDNVYAVIGILQASLRDAIELEVSDTVQEVNIDFIDN